MSQAKYRLSYKNMRSNYLVGVNLNFDKTYFPC